MLSEILVRPLKSRVGLEQKIGYREKTGTEERPWCYSLRPRCCADLAAAFPVIGDIVHLRRNLKDRARRVAIVVVVDVQEVGRTSPVRPARVGGQSQAAVSLGRVGLVEEVDGRDQQRRVEDVELDVEVVVHEVQPVPRSIAGQVRGTLDDAGEVAVGGVEGRLPHLGELVEQPGERLLVGLVIHEHDDALAPHNHLLEGRPVIEGHGEIGRLVHIPQDAGLFDMRRVERWVRVVAVAQHDGDDVVRVIGHPLPDLREPVGDGTRVKQVACRVAEVRLGGILGPLDLGLKEADAVVELHLDRKLLIGARVARTDKGGVVAAHVGDVAVLAGAELNVIIARLCVGGLWDASRGFRCIATVGGSGEGGSLSVRICGCIFAEAA